MHPEEILHSHVRNFCAKKLLQYSITILQRLRIQSATRSNNKQSIVVKMITIYNSLMKSIHNVAHLSFTETTT